MNENEDDLIFDILKEEEKQLKDQIPSFLTETSKSSPSKLFSDYKKTGNSMFKEAAGTALDFLRTTVGKAKEWTSDNAGQALTGVAAVGAMATPRGRMMIAEEVAPTVFKGFDDVSTAVLEKLSGRSRVSKQFIQDSLKQADIKQAEKNLIQPVLDEMGDVVDVNDFANRVKTEILPLERNINTTPRYEMVNLPSYKKGPTVNYQEHIYSSPIETSAGSVHFSPWKNSNMPSMNDVNASNKYFAHTRTEDLAVKPIRNVLEVQSDLMQRGRLESEKLQSVPYEGRVKELEKSGMRLTDAIKQAEDERNAIIEAKLEPYRNTWWNRIVRQEIKQAGDDGMTKIRFPVGKTAMEIEGLGTRINRWYDRYSKLSEENLKVGKQISDGMPSTSGHIGDWIITEVLGDGKFKAVPKSSVRTGAEISKDTTTSLTDPNLKKIGDEDMYHLPYNVEQFDISGKVESNNPIYRFYEDDIGKFLKNKFNAKRVTDDKGVEWWEVDTGPFKGKPVLAHAAAPILGSVGVEESQQDDNDRSMFGKAMAGAAMFAAAATPKGRKLLAKELPAEKLFKGLTNVLKKDDSLKLSSELSKAVGNKSKAAFLDEYDVAIGVPHDIMPIEKLKPLEYDNFADIRTMKGEPNNKTIEVRNAAVDKYKAKLLAGEKVEPIIITVDSKTGQAYVKDGHHRIQAYIELGKTDIPVFYDGKTLRDMWEVSQKSK